MSHGSGGRATAELIESLFLKHYANTTLRQHNDFASLELPPGRVVMSTDSHVIAPLFFPGGDIGSLAVHGTINDIAMAGARPLYLAAAFILEEGLALRDLERIVSSMAQAARNAQVQIVCGDTKVVEQGKADGVFISTTGIGVVPPGVDIAADRARPGDLILINGPIGDHGIAVLSQREHLQFDSSIESDSAALHSLVAQMVTAVPGIHCLRDPTRGGLATSLNELAQQSVVGMQLDESRIPVRQEVAAACELLGLDPLYIANEGKLIAISPPAQVETLLSVMRDHPLGSESCVVGEVVADEHCLVQMRTRFGGQRLVDWLASDPLPRIC